MLKFWRVVWGVVWCGVWGVVWCVGRGVVWCGVVWWVLFVVEGREFVQCWMTRGGRA